MRVNWVMSENSENSAFPTVSKCPLAEVYSLAKVCSTAQLSQRIKIHPEIQETQCGSPCDPNWEALPRVSRLAGRVISGINTAVFVSPPVLETEPAGPARRVQLDPRTLAPTPSGLGEGAPPNSHRAPPSRRTRLEANLGPLGKLAERP